MSIDLIRAKQRELAEAKAAAEKAAADRIELAKQAFISTGIPEMWAAIQNIQVPHWRGNGSRETDNTIMVPLTEHLKKLTDTSLALRDWDDEQKIVWKIEVTDKGAVWYTRQGRSGTAPVCSTKAEELQHDFADYMAKFLPPLEGANG